MIHYALNQISETVNFGVCQTQNSSSGKIGISHEYKERIPTQIYVHSLNFLTFQSNMENTLLIAFSIFSRGNRGREGFWSCSCERTFKLHCGWPRLCSFAVKPTKKPNRRQQGTRNAERVHEMPGLPHGETLMIYHPKFTDYNRFPHSNAYLPNLFRGVCCKNRKHNFKENKSVTD